MYLVTSGAEVVVHTPAKVNLFLEVLGKRPDGFHDIETCMVAVSQFDTLRCRTRNDDDCRLSCRWSHGLHARGGPADHRTGGGDLFGAVPTDSRNLALRAVQRLREHAGISQGIDIELIKRIPAEAGLGGASSDAAAALAAANLVWNLRWPRGRLIEIAAELGSDVPFFLGGDRRPSFGAVCSGRGERIAPFDAQIRLHLVLIKPPVGLSTAEVYRRCTPAKVPRNAESLLAALGAGHLCDVGRLLFNRLGETASILSPCVQRLSRRLQKLSCLGFLMSGSGSSFFALCRHRQHARRLASELRSIAAGTVFCVETIPLEFTLA